MPPEALRIAAGLRGDRPLAPPARRDLRRALVAARSRRRRCVRRAGAASSPASRTSSTPRSTSGRGWSRAGARTSRSAPTRRCCGTCSTRSSSVAPGLAPRGAAAGHQGLRRACPAAHGAGAREPLGDARAAELLLEPGALSCASASTGKAWHWSILRPVLIVGDSVGSAMNVIPALGVYAAMMRRAGKTALDYPGGVGRVAQAVDADLLARAIAWSGESATARERDLQRHQRRRLRLAQRVAGDRRRAGLRGRRARAAGARQGDPAARGGVGGDPRAARAACRAR